MGSSVCLFGMAAWALVVRVRVTELIYFMGKDLNRTTHEGSKINPSYIIILECVKRAIP